MNKCFRLISQLLSPLKPQVKMLVIGSDNPHHLDQPCCAGVGYLIWFDSLLSFVFVLVFAFVFVFVFLFVFGSIRLCWCGLSKLIYLQSLSAAFQAFERLHGARRYFISAEPSGKYIAKKSHKRQDLYLNASFNFYHSLHYLSNYF